MSREDMTLNMPDVTIALENVVKRFGNVTAVDGVRLDITRGEFLAVMGPSGCGKTTLLRMIAGLEQPTSGSIVIDGQRVNDVKPWRRGTPLVWQSFALFPHLDVAGNVGFGLRMQRVPKAERERRVQKALSMVSLDGYGKRRIDELSGGQMQRVGIARAMVLDPKVLLLDEPMGALDAKIGRTMQGELRRLHTELGITFVYVTHNQSEALALASRIVVMDGGQIKQVGEPTDVYRRPQNRFVAEFVGTNNVFSGTVVRASENLLHIDTPQGVFTALEPEQCHKTTGDRVSFAVNADRVHTQDVGNEAPNKAHGTIRAIETMGWATTVSLELPDGYELRFSQSEREMGMLQHKIGGEVGVYWESEAAFVMPEG